MTGFRRRLYTVTQVSERQDLPEHGVSVIFVYLANTKLELLHPLGVLPLSETASSCHS
jgi:hypothetical protein